MGLGGTKETGCRYQQVHKQQFRLYLFREHGGDFGLGGDLGTRRQAVGLFTHMNNHLDFIFLGDMGGTWG